MRIFLNILSVFMLCSFAVADIKEEVQNGITNFAFNMLHKLHAQASADGNVLCSPINVYNALALLHLGAAGKTRQELTNLLGLPKDDNEYMAQFHKRLGSVVKSIVENKPSIANVSIAAGAFLQQNLIVKPAYLELIKKYYNSSVSNVDFQNPSIATDTINNWISGKTYGRIPKLFGSPLSPNTIAILAATLYFNAKWDNNFEDYNTQTKKFNTCISEIQIPMMTKSETVRYYKDPSLQFEAIGLPYRQRKFIHYILLPQTSQSLQNLTAAFNSEAFKNLVQSAENNKRYVEMEIPKMKFSWSNSLLTMLKELGLKSLFENSNLSNMLDEATTISDINHATDIEMNETGTVASAVTTIGVLGVAFRPPPPEKIKFVVDRPFMFVIYHPETESILFTGSVHKPIV